MPILPPPPGPNPNNIGDQLARALAAAIALRHEKESFDYNKQAHQFALKKMAFDEQQQKIEEARTAFERQRGDALTALKALTGQDAPINDVSNGVSGVQGLPQQSNALAQSVPAGPTSLEDFMANKGPELAQVGRMDTSAAMPVGKLPEIQLPIAPGQTVRVRPDTREQLNQDEVTKQLLLAQAAGTRAGLVTAATQQARAANPVARSADTPRAVTEDVAAAVNRPDLVGLELTPNEFKMAVTSGLSAKTLEVRKQAMADARNRASRPNAGPVVKLSYEDDNGNTVVEYVTKEEALGRGPMLGPMNATTKNRIVSAKAAFTTGEQIQKMLEDPALANQVGLINGQATSLLNWMGSAPDNFRDLTGAIEGYAASIGGIHGMRSYQIMKKISDDLGPKFTASGLASYIQGLNRFSDNLIQQNIPQKEQQAELSAYKPGDEVKGFTMRTPAAIKALGEKGGTTSGTRKKINGKWYLVNGNSISLDPNQKE